MPLHPRPAGALLERFVSDDVRAAARYNGRSLNLALPLRHADTPHADTTLLWWGCPRHFVPGYDRTVPPGHLATGFG
jgi:hypothetical protein